MRNADERWMGVGVEKMNSVILIGNLASDVETREVGDGRHVATFRLAVQRRFVNQQGEREADFFPIVVWGKAADACARYLCKGRKAAVEGRLQARSYQAQDGGKRYVTEVVAEQVEFLSSAQRESGGSAGAEAPADGFADYGGELPF